MSRKDLEIKVTPSIIDRLLDFEPRISTEPAKSRSKSLQELKQSVRRDLEWLLNTRKTVMDVPDTLEEVNNSLAVYGLHDLTGISIKNPKIQKALIEDVEKTIKTFEPRFLDLKISLEPFDNTDKQLRFKIEARLDVEPTPEPIVFDTVLELGSGDFDVKQR
ncbi:MAG: type VI secretion system baseplate subunit TssE [Pyrinomonadaceae bacterium]|nr:type VI secretion system baseplate subunit TssE [Pyrinomonadaceae bacterium]